MENTEPQARAEIRVHGRVQGVFFRSSTRKQAHSLGIQGYVKNMPDGTVQAVFEGSKSDVQQLISWCHKGPPSAQVESVDIEWADPTGDFSSFSVRY